MAPPIAHRKQYFLNEMQARFCCPGKKTFVNTIELGRCFGLWVSFALILNQPPDVRAGSPVILVPQTA